LRFVRLIGICLERRALSPHFRFLIAMTMIFSLISCTKQRVEPDRTFDHPRDGYSVPIPSGWSESLKDQGGLSVLEILSDTTRSKHEQAWIAVISDQTRQPFEFTTIVRDASMKMGIIRSSSHFFALQDSSRIMVDGREGIMYQYDRIPRSQEPTSTASRETSIFLQATHGLISIKYIAPLPQVKRYATLFHAHLQKVKIRDIGPPVTDEAYRARLEREREEKRRVTTERNRRPKREAK